MTTVGYLPLHKDKVNDFALNEQKLLTVSHDGGIKITSTDSDSNLMKWVLWGWGFGRGRGRVWWGWVEYGGGG